MKQAREAHSEDAMCDMLCLLVQEFKIPHDEVEDMPYLRSEVLMDWYVKVNTPKKEGHSFSGIGMGAVRKR